jgi:hypothetical protein
VAYLGYSLWARLDARYPIVAALGLLVVAGAMDGVGQVDLANTLVVYVFLLMAGGVGLLLVDQVRRNARPIASAQRPAQGAEAETPGPDPAKDGQAPTQETLDGLQQQPVALVEASAQKHHQHEQPYDPEGEEG